jgi:HJR/Mrr/RecB family endonuclease
MRRPDGRVERIINSVVSPLSYRAITALAIGLWAAGLVLPLVLQWSVLGIVASNVVATSFAFTALMVWISVQIEARDRRHLVEWTSDLRKLSAGEFEWFVGEVFRREGWEVEETGRQDGPDGNIDLKLSRGRERAIVQCKRFDSRHVKVDEIRKFVGTLTREGLAAKDGVFVTLSRFNEHAVAEAKQTGLQLVDGVDLHARAEKVRRVEACPVCGAAMLLSRSSYGWWYRCVTDGCGGKRHLAKEPGRAVEVLTRE